MALVILTTASTSPWTVPGDLVVTGHKVTLIGSGGNGATSTTGASSVAGGGGGGGACTALTYSSGTVTPGTTTIAFLINAGGSANATQWQSSAAGSGAFYEALPGGNAAAGTAGGASGSTTTVGSPTITYTPANHTGAAGGAGGGANTLGGGGGGGSGGPNANGGGGATPTSTGGGGGGGGGAANAGSNSGSATGGTGGNGSTGAGGTAGNSGTGSSGGGGGNGGQNTATGNGGSGSDFSTASPLAGCGGGGGGGGGDTVNQATTSSGGTGGNYGGGGGGRGCVRGSSTGTLGSGAAGVIAIAYSSNAWGFDQQSSREAQPLRQSALYPRRHAGARHRSPFGIFPPWYNRGWEEVSSQEPRRRWEKQAAAIMPKDDGTQAPYIRFIPTAWNTDTRSQEPHPRPERAGAIMFGDAGIEGVFVFVPPTAPVTFGFEQVFAQPPHAKWPFGALRFNPGFAFFNPWINLGFEETATQPLHRFFKSPDTGDQGIQFPMPTVAVTLTPWGYDIQQMTSRKSYRSPDAGDQGIQASLITFFPNGWPQVSSQDRYRFWKSPEFGDQGIQSPFQPFFPPSWIQVGPQDRHPRWERFGAIAPKDDGIAFPVLSPPLFETSPPLLYHRLFHSPEFGDQGIQSPFQPFFPSGWQQVSSQDKHSIYRVPTLGDPLGIDFPFTQFFPIGFDQVFAQPVHRFWKSPEFGDQGIQFPFAPPTAFPLGWEQIFAQPVHRFSHSPEFGDQGIQSPYIQFFPSGWQQTASQDKHTIWKSPTLGDPAGINAPYIQFIPIGWPEPPMHQRLPRNRAAAWMFGDLGNQFPMPAVLTAWFENTPPLLFHRLFHSPEFGDSGIAAPYIQFFPAGWAQVASQDKHTIWKSPTTGDPGGINAPYIQFFPLGWDQIFAQPVHRFLKSPEFGDMGIEFPFVPPTQFPLGWEQIFSQPVHKFFHSPEFGDQGIQSPYLQFFPFGWEVQPPQPPHHIWKSPTTGDTGIAAPFILFRPYGWEVQPPQPPHTWVRHRGAFMRGIDGIERPFLFWVNLGFEQTTIQPRLWPMHRTAGIMRGDEGIQFPYIRFFPDGWAQVFTQPRFWTTIRQRGAFLFGEPGIEAPQTPPPAFLTNYTYGQVDALTRRNWQYRYAGMMPWGDWGIYSPFVPPVIIPPTPLRVPTGKVFTLDTVQGYLLGTMPFKNESCNLIFVVGPGLTTGPVLLTFTRPDGTTFTGDPNFAFIGPPTITQRRINDEVGNQYIVYTFAIGELNQVGTWKVSAITANYFSQTFSFP